MISQDGSPILWGPLLAEGLTWNPGRGSSWEQRRGPSCAPGIAWGKEEGETSQGIGGALNGNTVMVSGGRDPGTPAPSRDCRVQETPPPLLGTQLCSSGFLCLCPSCASDRGRAGRWPAGDLCGRSASPLLPSQLWESPALRGSHSPLTSGDLSELTWVSLAPGPAPGTEWDPARVQPGEKAEAQPHSQAHSAGRGTGGGKGPCTFPRAHLSASPPASPSSFSPRPEGQAAPLVCFPCSECVPRGSIFIFTKDSHPSALNPKDGMRGLRAGQVVQVETQGQWVPGLLAPNSHRTHPPHSL